MPDAQALVLRPYKLRPGSSDPDLREGKCQFLSRNTNCDIKRSAELRSAKRCTLDQDTGSKSSMISLDMARQIMTQTPISKIMS